LRLIREQQRHHVSKIGVIVHDQDPDPSGAVVGLGDARAQARQCYKNLAVILAHYGGSFRHLMKTTTYITHWAYRPLVAAARDELFPAAPYPANTLVVALD